MNEVISAAVSAHNQQATAQVVQGAVALIVRITEQQHKIDECLSRIADHQTQLAQVANDVIDQARVFGGSLPANANQSTIAAIIEKANSDRKFTIESKASRLTASIVAEQDAIKSIELQIAGFRQALLQLTPATVEVATVTGN